MNDGVRHVRNPLKNILSRIQGVQPESGQDMPWYMHADALRRISNGGAPDLVKEHAATLIKQGYVVIKNAISASLCDDAVVRFREWVEKHRELIEPYKDENGYYYRLVNMHLVIPPLLDVFANNRTALQLLDYLFANETILYTSLFYERGSAQPIHRDTPYFWTKPGYSYFGLWTALEDTDGNNGPLEVIAGGHDTGEPDLNAIALSHFPNLSSVPADSQELWDSYQNEVQARCASKGLVKSEVHVKKGDCIIWHPQLPHGGSQIRDTSRTRLSLVVHAIPPHVPVYHQDVFFNRQKAVPDTHNWRLGSHSGRRYVDHDVISFSHKRDVKVGDLRD